MHYCGLPEKEKGKDDTQLGMAELHCRSYITTGNTLLIVVY